MKTLRYMAAALAAAGLMAVPANATTFVFKGDGNNVTPTNVGNVDATCATTYGGPGTEDLCTINHAEGFNYSLDGINLNVTAYEDVESKDDIDSLHATRLIQDRFPIDSGLGAWSEGSINDDQTQFDSKEAIRFLFEDVVALTDVEFNAGGDTDCSNPGLEGPCGSFELYVDGLFMGVIAAVDNNAHLGNGMEFLLIAVTDAAGFTIAQFTVSEVPVPAALPLLLSGLAGLGFASRRRKTA